METPFDVAIVGAGAAGLFCAGIAAQRGARVAIIDHAARLGEKIRISGGGRCNFTNLAADRPERYQSEDPRFARAALRAFPPARFVDLVRRHGIGFHEKHRGQLFCDDSSERIIAMLRAEITGGEVQWRVPSRVVGVRACASGFEIETDGGMVRARTLVVATGGLSIPKIGATDLGYRIARQFGIAMVPTRPALVPLTFADADWKPFVALSGSALPVEITAPGAARGRDGNPGRHAIAFSEDLLITHRGLSGPAALQASTYWHPGESLVIDLSPGIRLEKAWIDDRPEGRQMLITLLASSFPRRFSQVWLERFAATHPSVRGDQRLAEVGHRTLRELAASLHRWAVKPDGTEGYRKAEVTAGGVATDELDPRTMQARRVPGLHFIGEVVDVTGWLGGYNFQWAWSSAHAAAMAITTAESCTR
ncbi:MAG: hypothetical protein RIS35_962 [Pseudomonadota bacterium]